MNKTNINKKQLQILILICGLLFSCQDNPVSPIETDNIIYVEYKNLEFEIIEETDSTQTLHTIFEIIYYPKNSGLQLLEHGFMMYNTTRSHGGGTRWSYENRIRSKSRRSNPVKPYFIESGQKDTLSYSLYCTDYRKDDPYTTFEYKIFGIYTDEPVEFDFDSLSTNCLFYFYSDTIIYDE